jgi:hypothetical protein
MDSGEYAKRWTKSEGEELDTLSVWIKSIRKLLKSRIHHLSGKMRTIYPSVFQTLEVVNELHRLHDNFVLVPADLKQVATLSSFVTIAILNAFSMAWDLPLLLGIPLIL